MWLNRGGVELTGPAGAEPWVFDIDATDHPTEIVSEAIRDRIGEPLLLHSTSWRHDDGAVILTFVAIVDATVVDGMASRPIRRSELARSDATEPPPAVDTDQVVEHALRHVAWLTHDDPVIGERLSEAWRTALADYVPEPFRNLA